MSMFVLDSGKNITEAEALKRFSLKEVGVQEGDARDLAVSNIAAFFADEELFVLGREYSGWDGSKRRLDILAIDKSANFVVIEFKRDDDAGHAELQALRYAAMVSVLNLTDLLDDAFEVRKKYVNEAQSRDDFEKELREFLSVEDLSEVETLKIPRIFLVSSGFSAEVTTTVLWLNEQFGSLSGESPGMDISCFEMSAYKHAGGLCFYLDQIIPIKQAAEYKIKAKVKENTEFKNKQKQKAKNTWRVLEESGVLVKGVTVRLIKPGKADGLSELVKTAQYEGSGAYSWCGEIKNSLNAVHLAVLALAGDTTGAPVQATAYWAIAGQQQSLAELAKEALNGQGA